MGNSSGVARLLAAASVFGLWVTPALAAGETRSFSPSTEWTLESDAESCWVTRRFGSGKDEVAFRLQAFSPGSSYRVLLWGRPMPQRNSGALEFAYSFKPDTGSIPTAGVLNGSRDQSVVMFMTTLETSAQLEARRESEIPAQPVDAPREAAIDEFVIAFSRGRPLSLQLGSMQAPLAQLRACASELVGKWGLDPVVQESLERLAVPIDQEKWIGPGSYPANYFWVHRSLMVHLRIMVDASGKPSECVVQAPKTQSGAEALACREIVKTARFEPAVDSTGNPVPSYFATTVFYFSKRRNGN